jgi:hypothetical protein
MYKGDNETNDVIFNFIKNDTKWPQKQVLYRLYIFYIIYIITTTTKLKPSIARSPGTLYDDPCNNVLWPAYSSSRLLRYAISSGKPRGLRHFWSTCLLRWVRIPFKTSGCWCQYTSAYDIGGLGIASWHRLPGN